VEDIIAVGNDLLAVKKAPAHGQFGPRLKAEFGWSEQSAQNFMSVAERFKFTEFAALPIQPSAAYLLAARDDARQVAVEKAEAGEEITFSTAREIVAATKKNGRKKAKPIPADKLGLRLVKSLERFKKQGIGQEYRHIRPTTAIYRSSHPGAWHSVY
jgi:hypothetical protein